MKRVQIKLERNLLFTLLLFTFSLQINGQYIDESFEGSWPPTGWIVINNGSGNTWTQNVDTDYSFNGTKSAMYEYNSSNAADAWLFTKSVTLAAGEYVSWSFYDRVADSGYPENLKFTVGTAQTVAAQTTILLDLNAITNEAWVNYTGSYTAPNAGSYYFAFNCYSPANMFDLFVDDLYIETVTCPDPTNQTATNISGLTADLGWTDDNSTVWDIEWGDKNFNQGSGTTVTGVSNPYTVTVGTHGNEYDFYVRSDCGVDGTSNWVGPYTWLQVDIPDCVTLDSPVDGAVDQSLNVFLSWTPASTGDAATLYDIYFGTVSGSISYIGSIPETSTQISGLEVDQTYYWYINPYNTSGANDCSSAERSFTTKSAPSGPSGLTCNGSSSKEVFEEEFEALGDWTGDIVLFEENGKWVFRRVGQTTSANTGPDGAYSNYYYMFYEASGNTTDVASAISPPIDLTYASDEAELSFWMHANGLGIGTFEVGVSTSDSGPFTNLFTWDGPIQNAIDDPWHNVGVDLSAYVGSVIYIELKHTGTGDYRGDMSIDLFEVSACYTCLEPTDVTSSNVEITTADVTWTDGFGCSSDVTVNVTPAIPGSPFTVACGIETISLTGLTQSTDYTVEIVNNCFGVPSTSTTFVTKPPNDECSGAYVLTVNDDYVCGNVTSGTIKGATQSPGPLNTCVGYEDDDVWFSFVATDTSHRLELLNISGGSANLCYAVWEGDCASGPTLIPGACATYQNELDVDGLVIGDTYFVKVYSHQQSIFYSNTFDLCVGRETSNVPPNDNLCDATELIVDDAPIVSTNTNATSESGEPNGSCWGNLGEFESVWFYFVAPSTGNVRVTNDFETLLEESFIAIYEVGGCSEMGSLVQVGCDDGYANNGMCVADIYNLTPGDTYYVQVDGCCDNDDAFKIQVLTICDNSLSVLPESAGATTSTGKCIDGDWLNYYNGNNILLSLKLGNSEAVINSVTVDPDGNTNAFWVDNDSDGFPNVAAPATGASYMRRKWSVNVSTEPSSDVGVRFYYTQDEFDAMNGLITDNGGTPLTDHKGMNFYKVTSGDDAFDVGPGGIGSGDYELIVHSGTPGINEWDDGLYNGGHYAEFEVSSFSGGGAGAADGGQLLPIELISFKGYAEKAFNILEWSTLSEANTAKFVVERYEEESWIEITSVEAAGNSRFKREYRAVDKFPLSEGFYKLKTYDNDGNISISEIILINRGDDGLKLNSIYPNPNKGNFVLNISSSTNEIATIMMVNVLGERVYLKTFESLNSSSSLQIVNVEDLSNGIYSLILSQGGKKIIKKIVIAK